MPTAEQVTEARLSEFRDLARSGITEMTGRAIRAGGEGQGEFIGRHKGLKTAFPKDFNRVPDSPKQIAEAIERGAGKVYERVYAAVIREAEREGYKRARKRSPGRPTVAPHSGRSYCSHCKVAHTKGQHRFHGAGSYHQTHLFSFGSNPGGSMLTQAGAKRVFAAMMAKARERTLTANEKRALVIARQTLRAGAKRNPGKAGATSAAFKSFVEHLGYLTSSMRPEYLEGLYEFYENPKNKWEHLEWLKWKRGRKLFPDTPGAGLFNPRRRLRGAPTKAEMRKTRRRIRRGKKIVTLQKNPGGGRLSEQQIRDTVEAMRLSDKEKSVLLYRALVLNDAATRFVIYSRWQKQKTKSNPGGKGTVIYGQVIEIVCRRVGPHRCDAACKRVQHTYRHVFKSKPQIKGLDDGRLLIG